MKLNYKYIIVESGAVLFNEETVHAIVAEGFKVLKTPIYAAGFVTITPKLYTPKEPGKKPSLNYHIECHGRSESLNIDSQPEIDKIIIGDLFNPISKIKYYGMRVKPFYIK